MSSVASRLLVLPLAAVCLLSLAATPAPQQVSKQTAATLRDRLTIMVNNAVTTNAFDDMLGSLSKVNRDRIAETPLTGYDRLNVAVARVRKSYRAAYGRELLVTTDAFANIALFVDEDADHARGQLDVGTGGTMELHLVREGFIANRWRMELTNPTAESLAEALALRLEALAGDNWPRDAASGQQRVARSVMEALATARHVPIAQSAANR